MMDTLQSTNTAGSTSTANHIQKEIKKECLYLGYMKVSKTDAEKLKDQFLDASTCTYCENFFAEIIKCKCSVPFCGKCALVDGKNIIKCPSPQCGKTDEFSVTDDYANNQYIKDELLVPCDLPNGGRLDIHTGSFDDSGKEIKYEINVQGCSENGVKTTRVLRNLPDHVKCDHLSEEDSKILREFKNAVLTNILDDDEFEKTRRHNEVINSIKGEKRKISLEKKPDGAQYSYTSGEAAGRKLQMDDSSVNDENESKIPDIGSLSLYQDNTPKTNSSEKQYKWDVRQPDASALGEAASGTSGLNVKDFKHSDEIKKSAPQREVGINEFRSAFDNISEPGKMRIARIFDNTAREEVNDYYDEICQLCDNDPEITFKIIGCRDEFLKCISQMPAEPVKFKPSDPNFTKNPIIFHGNDRTSYLCAVRISCLFTVENIEVLSHMFGFYPVAKSGFDLISKLQENKVPLEDLKKVSIRNNIWTVASTIQRFTSCQEEIYLVPKELNKEKYLIFIEKSCAQLRNTYDPLTINSIVDIIVDFIIKFSGDDGLSYMANRLFDGSFHCNQETIEMARDLSTRKSSKDKRLVKNKIKAKISTSPIVPIRFLFEIIEELGLHGVLPRVFPIIDPLLDPKA